MKREILLVLFIVAVLVALTVLTGCAGSLARWCPAPITVSKQDVLTPETARQVLTIDREIRAVCHG